jgi:hypothetical protein
MNIDVNALQRLPEVDTEGLRPIYCWKPTCLDTECARSQVVYRG